MIGSRATAKCDFAATEPVGGLIAPDVRCVHGATDATNVAAQAQATEMSSMPIS
jgi:hypothetical protein